MHAPADHHRPALRWGVISWLVALAVLGGKAVAWSHAGTEVLFADAAESAVDVLAASMLVFVLRISRMPPDARHPWGHGKAEYFSAGFHGALTIAAGVVVLVEAGRSIGTPQEFENLREGAIFSIASLLLNLGLSLALLKAAREHDSPALLADARHNLADVWTTVAAWVGLGLAVSTGWWFLDPFIAALVGLHIVRTGYLVMRDAVDGLMDATLPPTELRRIAELIEGHMGPALEFHDLRARRASDKTFVEFHLVVNGAQSVEQAHQLCDALEEALGREIVGVQVQIHVEPEVERHHRPAMR